MKGAHFKKDKQRMEGQMTMGEQLSGNDIGKENDSREDLRIPAEEPSSLEAVESVSGSGAESSQSIRIDDSDEFYRNSVFSSAENIDSTENKDFGLMLEEVLHDLGLDEEEIRRAKEQAQNPAQQNPEPVIPPPSFIPTSSLEMSIEKLENELREAGEPLIPPTRDSAEAEEDSAEPVPGKTEENPPEQAPQSDPDTQAQASADPESAETESPVTPEAEPLQEASAQAENAAEEKSAPASEEDPAGDSGKNASFEINDLVKAAKIEDPEKKTGKGTRILFDFLEEIVFAVVIVVVIFSFLFRIVTVQGTSMETTFSGGDKLVVSSFIYKIKPGDVVVVVDVLEDPIIKRVIATEGQTVFIDNETGMVYVDGEKLDESAYTQNGITYARGIEKLEFPAVVPEKCVFVLGDNRVVSKDSRFDDVGMIPLDHLLGKAMVQVYPFSEIHLLG